MIKAGIFGATGYAGQQLVSILIKHPNVSLEFVSSGSQVGKSFSDIYPHFKNIFSKEFITKEEALAQLDDIDVVFTALPHGETFDIASAVIAKGKKLIDLSADFRIKDIDTYEHWYKVTHTQPELLEKAVYGLCELHKEEIKTAQLLSNPGCYPTASSLAMAPLLKTAGIIDEKSIIIDAKSGITGAGRKADLSLLVAEASESIKAYSIASHRHTPEIAQEMATLLGEEFFYLTFTPHLIPMKRGILATCYANCETFMSLDSFYEIYEDFYKDCPFVRIRREEIQTKYVSGTNYCDISLRYDIRTRRLIITSAIDNLVKGAAGQATQNMNIMFDLPETTGLDTLTPMVP